MPDSSSAPLSALAEAFDLPGDVVAAQRQGSGHIHETWVVTLLDQDRLLRFVLQRLNRTVFPDPDAMMSNIARVVAHLRSKLEQAGVEDRHRRALTLIPARGGALYHRDAEGEAWRAYALIEGARSVDVADSPARAHAAAGAFGRFLRDLADLPAPRLHETLPRFHHTPAYLARLEEVVARDPKNRAAGVQREIEAYLGRPKRRALARSLVDLQAAGAIPERAIHNDTKLNNVLFDERSGEALCVVDLDTVMPGLAPCDFGDMVRTATSPRPEDERNLATIEARPEIFEALARGYLEALRGVLTPAEIDNLAPAGALITLECGSRFLADYLAGDVYFQIQRPEQNLDRSRAQLALLQSLEAQDEPLRRIVERVERAERQRGDAPPAPASPAEARFTGSELGSLDADEV